MEKQGSDFGSEPSHLPVQTSRSLTGALLKLLQRAGENGVLLMGSLKELGSSHENLLV